MFDFIIPTAIPPSLNAGAALVTNDGQLFIVVEFGASEYRVTTMLFMQAEPLVEVTAW